MVGRGGEGKHVRGVKRGKNCPKMTFWTKNLFFRLFPSALLTSLVNMVGIAKWSIFNTLGHEAKGVHITLGKQGPYSTKKNDYSAKQTF